MADSYISEQQIVLQNVSWQLLEHLITDLGEQRSTRITYYQGQLEMMTPRWEHEIYHRLLDCLIQTLLEELELNVWMAGSTLLYRSHMKVAKEPASCYYIQNESKMRGKSELDLAQDPPPDLVLDLDLSQSSALNQFILYADLDIPEVWRYCQSQIAFYRLNHGAYVQCETSPLFDFLTPEAVHRYLHHCESQGTVSALKDLRAWINQVL